MGASSKQEQNNATQTAVADLQPIFKRLKEGFNTHKTFPHSYRRSQLQALHACLKDNEEAFIGAMQTDFKARNEAVLELRYTASEVLRAIDELESWMKPHKVAKTVVTSIDSVFVKPEPLGLALIIAPWNYPLNLAVEPLIGAISAGCAAIVKPSELSVHTSNALYNLLPKYLDSCCYSVVGGGPEVAKELLTFPFDFVFYTGSTAIGQKIYEAAASHLTPVALELGGKSPCIVTKNSDLDNVVGRIAWGKCWNAGQTCVAPDYVLCDASIVDQFVQKLSAKISQHYGASPIESFDFGRIVNERHFDRLSSLLDGVRDKVVHGGQSQREKRFMAPTIVLNPSLSSGAMSEEIFGPILPVISVANTSEAVKIVNSRPKPLSLYVFSKNSKEVDFVLAHTSSGSVCVNDVMMQIFLHSLPFGGVGSSGIGKYHGKASFDVFSHFKSVMWKSPRMEFLNSSLRYAPVSDRKAGWLQYLMFYSPRSSRKLQLGVLAVLLCGAALLIGYQVRGGFTN